MPFWVSISISPFRPSTLVRTTSRPTPRPASSLPCARRRKSRLKEQFLQLGLGQVRRFRGAGQSEMYGSGTHLFPVDTAAIVFDFDVNMVAVMIGTYRHLAVVGLAPVVSFLFPFDAMGNGISHQVQQRVGDLLKDVAVQFGFRSRQFQSQPVYRPLLAASRTVRERRVNRPPIGTIAPRNFVLQAVCEFTEFINIRIDPADEGSSWLKISLMSAEISVNDRGRILKSS